MRTIPNTNIELMDFCAMRIADMNSPNKTHLKAITSVEQYNQSYIYSQEKNDKAKSSLSWNPMDDDWKDRCKSTQWWAQNSYEDASKFYDIEKPLSRKLYNLRDKLLTFGGEMACMPAYPDTDTDNIIKYGQLWLGKNHKMMRGLPSQCHFNSCRCWVANTDKTRICTGFALSPDGMWREHSWLIHIKPQSNIIIETTVPRIAYFGYVMTTEQCEQFVEDCDAY